MEQEVVTLFDEQGRSLSCSIERVIDIESKKYLLLQPIHSCVQIFAWEEDGEGEVLTDLQDDQIDLIFPTAQAVLAELNLSLHRTAYSLTVEGEIPESDEDNIFSINTEGDEDALEELLQIANFYHHEQEYSVFVSLDPLIFFARYNDAGKIEMLDDAALEALQIYLEEIILNEEDSEEEEEENS